MSEAVALAPLAPEDVPEAARLLARCFLRAPSETWLASDLPRPGRIYLGLRTGLPSDATAASSSGPSPGPSSGPEPTTPGALLGVAGGRLVLDELEVVTIAVLPEARGRGLGGRLLRGLAAEAEAQGAERMVLEVRPSNAPARALYAAHGLRQTGRRPGYYALEGEDALLMSGALSRIRGRGPGPGPGKAEGRR